MYVTVAVRAIKCVTFTGTQEGYRFARAMVT